ncbi:MAG TPA: glutamine amidotransferase [Candidatus Saccharimonadales bacterium]
MNTKPFLLLQTRPEDETSNDEYDGFLRASGLSSHQLERIRVEAAPLPKLDLTMYSGIILGGGPFDISKPHDMKSDVQKRVEADLTKLLDELIDKDFPFFGACYGIGTLGNHQGGVISDKYAETVMAAHLTLTKEGKTDPLCAGLPDTFRAIVGHKESCEVLPKHAIHLVSSPDCPIQMFRIKNNLYATQFHPELDMKGLRVRVGVYKHAGYFAPEDADDIIRMAEAVDLSHAPTVLRNFVQKYTQAA